MIGKCEEGSWGAGDGFGEAVEATAGLGGEGEEVAGDGAGMGKADLVELGGGVGKGLGEDLVEAGLVGAVVLGEVGALVVVKGFDFDVVVRIDVEAV